MELLANHPDLEQLLRLQVLEAWKRFEQVSRQSRDSAKIYNHSTSTEDFDYFFRYQRAFKRFNDLVVFGKAPDEPA